MSVDSSKELMMVCRVAKRQKIAMWNKNAAGRKLYMSSKGGTEKNMSIQDI